MIGKPKHGQTELIPQRLKSKSLTQSEPRWLNLAIEEAIREALNESQNPAAVESLNAWLKIVTPAYHWDWNYSQYIQSRLDAVTAGDLNKLMVFLPPRHGKSELCTIRYPVYRLERNPAQHMIVGAYNQMLANKFSRRALKIAATRFNLNTQRHAVEDWETEEGGGLRAVGVGGGITGQGGDLVIIDDPIKSREEAESVVYRDRVWDWYTNDLYTRQEPGCALVLIMTRWHKDDLAGRILASDDGPNWTVINLPAEAEDSVGPSRGDS